MQVSGASVNYKYKGQATIECARCKCQVQVLGVRVRCKCQIKVSGTNINRKYQVQVPDLNARCKYIVKIKGV